MKKITIFLLTLLIILNNFLCFNVDSVQAKTINSPNNYDWNEIDASLVTQLKKVRQNTEEFAESELDYWIKQLMKNVDNQFLDWYFNYFNQKAMEFGIPFAWIVLKLDEPLKVFRSDEEKNLNAGKLIDKRIIDNFNRKFEELVFNEEAGELFNDSLERIVRNYASSVNFSIATVKNYYQIPDQDWENHLQQIAYLIYDTGTSKNNLSSESFNSDLVTKLSTLASISIGGKLLAKVGQKIAVKTGTKVAGEVGTLTVAGSIAKFIDPFLALGFLAWDTWDYNSMVAHSRPELRQNILDYLNELKYSIIDGSENSIMAGIDEVQNQLLSSFGSLS